jgi:multidrug efflux pump subunit AcrB
VPNTAWCVLKMLPFDNKSEFQVVVDMPAGTPLEDTAAALHEMGAHLATQPEVQHCRAMPARPAPINFNGLVRQYYLRADAEQGDLQVNLVDKGERRTRATPSRSACARAAAHRRAPRRQRSRWSRCRPARRC